jgi:C1A family cysteine protease
MLHRLSAAALAALLLPACLTDSPESEPVDPEAAELEPLSSLDEISAYDVTEVEPPTVSKAVPPAKHTALLALQSPVKNQARRGVCSIFSSTALVEHLYMKAGAPALDFSEQYLQWSSKVQVGAFTDSEGSNDGFNLQAVVSYGIPMESAWPYEPASWNTSHNSACTGGDDLPTICYTNGDPPQVARDAKKYFLPSRRSLGRTPIKQYITDNNAAVAVGLEFFYQAWNHGSSTLPINQAAKRLGIVTNPSTEDVTESRTRGAGHAILLVGWDDNFEAPLYGPDGEPLLDANGNPRKERGFYIFKNSWGTTSFGVDNPYGAGYGFISQAYVANHARGITVANVPALVERCTGGEDEDFDGAIDCDDTACATNAACLVAANPVTVSAAPNASIPDANTTGISNALTIDATGAIQSLQVSVDIAHPYIGDLIVTLSNGTRTVTLHNKTGGGTDNLIQTYSRPEFNGLNAAGTWTLKVSDRDAQDVGTLRSWSLSINQN